MPTDGMQIDPSKAGVHCLGECVVLVSCQSQLYLLPARVASPVVRISLLAGDCEHNALIDGSPVT